MSPGETAVEARILFSDGAIQQTIPRAIVVDVPDPPLGVVVFEGSLELEPEPGRFLPFTLPQDASQIEMFVDWISVLNRINFVLWEGSCSGTELCAGLKSIQLPEVSPVKPVRKATRNLPAGPYTIRIDNLGPGTETVSFEVRITPR